jgi:hypothetical protein
MDLRTITTINAQDLLYAFPIIFLVSWIVIVKIISKVSGWQELSEKYPSRTPFNGKKYNFQSARMKRGMNMNNCLTVGANHVGLYLSMFLLFSLGHKPIFIPWSEINATTEKGRFMNYTKLTFLRSPNNWLKITDKLSGKLNEDSKGQLSIQEAI